MYTKYAFDEEYMIGVHVYHIRSTKDYMYVQTSMRRRVDVGLKACLRQTKHTYSIHFMSRQIQLIQFDFIRLHSVKRKLSQVMSINFISFQFN